MLECYIRVNTNVFYSPELLYYNSALGKIKISLNISYIYTVKEWCVNLLVTRNHDKIGMGVSRTKDLLLTFLKNSPACYDGGS